MSPEFLHKFLCWCSDRHIAISDLWFRTRSENQLQIFINCNDYFYYATADCEEITEENFPILEEAYQQLYDLNDEFHIFAQCYVFELFTVKVRKESPLQYYLAKMKPELRKLFNICSGQPEDYGESYNGTSYNETPNISLNLPYYFDTGEQFIPTVHDCYCASDKLGCDPWYNDATKEWEVYVNHLRIHKCYLRYPLDIYMPKCKSILDEIQFILKYYIERKEYKRIAKIIQSLYTRRDSPYINWPFAQIKLILEMTHNIQSHDYIKMYRDALITNISWNRKSLTVEEKEYLKQL